MPIAPMRCLQRALFYASDRSHRVGRRPSKSTYAPEVFEWDDSPILRRLRAYWAALEASAKARFSPLSPRTREIS